MSDPFLYNLSPRRSEWDEITFPFLISFNLIFSKYSNTQNSFWNLVKSLPHALGEKHGS
jgi:hypothetical protein